MAIATSALEMRSPEVSSMSISRAGGAGHTCLARSSRSSVVSPIAETTTTTSLPGLLGLDDALGDAADPLGVRHRGSAVLLHDERHWKPFASGVQPRIRGLRTPFTPPVASRCGQDPPADPVASRAGLGQLRQVVADPGVQRRHFEGRRWSGRAGSPRLRLSANDGELPDELVGELGDRHARRSEVGACHLLRTCRPARRPTLGRRRRRPHWGRPDRHRFSRPCARPATG